MPKKTASQLRILQCRHCINKSIILSFIILPIFNEPTVTTHHNKLTPIGCSFLQSEEQTESDCTPEKATKKIIKTLIPVPTVASSSSTLSASSANGTSRKLFKRTLDDRKQSLEVSYKNARFDELKNN